MTEGAQGAEDAGQDVVLPENAQRVAPGPGGSVILPAGTNIDDIQVAGRDLVIELPDGSFMIIEGGAVFVPQFIIGGIEVPPTTLAALLIDEEPQPAAGDTPSSGGNFFIPVPNLGPGIPIGDLLPPTELFYTPPEYRELGLVEDNEPEILIDTPEEPFAVPDAVAIVYESGLPEGDGTFRDDGEPEGTASASDGETTTGTFVFTSPDNAGPVVAAGGLTVNGVVVTEVGQIIQGTYGYITITGGLEDGFVTFSYTLTDNTVNGDVTDVFIVTVTDPDGDSDTATLTIGIIDDAPIAVDDVVTLGQGQMGASGDVITGEGSDAGVGSKDTMGADGFGEWGVFDDGTLKIYNGADILIEGDWGTLTVKANGDWSYERFDEGAGGQTDTFVYVIRDADGSEATATLSIVIPDDFPTITPPTSDPSDPSAGDPGTFVYESGIEDGRNGEEGSDADSNSEFTEGVIAYTDGDLPSVFTIQIDGQWVALEVGESYEGDYGTLTIDSIGGGEIAYTYELTDHSNGDNVVEEFAIRVTDPDGPGAADDDVRTGTLRIQIIDDVPTAADDLDNVQEDEGEPVVVNVIGNDTEGADDVDLSNNNPNSNSDGGPVVSGIEYVEGSLTGDGEVTYLGGGEFSYAPAPGETGEVSFDYRIVDGDGDESIATVTIELLPDSVPQVGEAADLAADEDDLEGANADDDQAAPQPIETDGPTNYSGSVTVDFGDNQDTPTQANAMASFAFTAATVTALNAAGLTSDGQLITFVLSPDGHTITGTAAGDTEATITISLDSAVVNAATNEVTYNYSVDLDGPIDHPDQTDGELDPDVEDVFDLPAIGFEVTDADNDAPTGDVGTGSFIVSIRDDVPTAEDDVAEVSDADGLRSAEGNVIDDAPGADEEGADGAEVSRVDGYDGDTDSGSTMEVDGRYGTLTIDAEGNYVYEIDVNGADYADVLALGVNGELTDTFTYYLEDADGDVATATLTITINGSNQPPTGTVGNVVVSEEGLDDGLADDEPVPTDDTDSDTDTGTLNFSDGDTGDVLSYTLGDPSTVVGYQALYTADGQEIQWDTSDPNVLIGHTGDPTDPVITISIDYGADLDDPSDDFYTVDLDQPLFHGTQGGDNPGDGNIEGELDIVIPLTVSDGNGGELDTSFTVEIEDDSPEVTADDNFDGQEEIPTLVVTSDAEITDVSNAVDFSGAFTFESGGDGYLGGSLDSAVTYSLEVDDSVATGIFDTKTGLEVQLEVDGDGLVHGFVNDPDEGKVDVFTVSVDGDGQVTVTQYRAVEHYDGAAVPANESDVNEAIADGALSLTARVYDQDYDYAADSIDLGSRIRFADDGVEAVDDADEVTDAAGFYEASGNVITDAENNGDNGADNVSEDLPNEIIQIDGYAGDSDGRPVGDLDTQMTVEGQYGTLVINADGSYTYTLDTNGADYDDIVALGDGETLTDTFTYTLSDGDDDTATADLVITINGIDDGPYGNVDGAVVSEEGLDNDPFIGNPDGDPASVLDPADPSDDDYTDNTNAASVEVTMNFADPDNDELDYILGDPSTVDGNATLYAADGSEIEWTVTNSGATLTGRDGSGDTVIVIQINQNGANDTSDDSYTVTLYEPVYHDGGDEAFDGDGNIEGELSFLVPLTVSDGTPANDLETTIKINIEDDKPVVTDAAEPPAINGLQTSDATLGDAGEDTQDYSGQFSVAFGGDGPQGGNAATAVEYTLGLNYDLSTDSTGLVDTATGNEVELRLNGAGEVEGYYDDGGDGVVVFTLSVDGAGVVTLNQERAVEHYDGASVPANESDVPETISGTDVITLTATATDDDDDSASHTIDITGDISFADDAPSISADPVADDFTIALDESRPEDTDVDGVNLTDGDVSVSVDVSGYFSLDDSELADDPDVNTDLSNDQPNTIAYSMFLAGGLAGVASGVYAIADDGGQGAEITLYYFDHDNDADTPDIIVGSTAADADSINGLNSYFQIEVDGDGQVIFTQFENVWHGDDSDNDDAVSLDLADNTLGVTATITDGDDDSASATLDLSGGVFVIEDDGPVVTDATIDRTVDEDGVTDGIPGGEGDVDGEITEVTGSVASLFDLGSDTPGSYGINTDTSGLPPLASGGLPVLYDVTGDTLTAYVVDPDTLVETSVFTLQVESDGTYTFTLLANLDHATLNGLEGDDTENDLILDLSAAIVGYDGDGDSVVAADDSFEITVDDDTPVEFTPDAVAALDGNTAPITADLNLQMGADGLGSLVFDIVDNTVATDQEGNILKVGTQQIYLYGDDTGQIVGSTGMNGTGTIAFTVTLNMDGTYTFDVNETITNGTATSFTNLTTARAGNVEYRAVGAGNPTNNSDNIDVILSAVGGDGTQQTINTSSTSIGVANQSVTAGQTVRFDLVQDAVDVGGNAGGGTGFDYDSYSGTDRFQQTVPQTNGPVKFATLNIAAVADPNQQNARDYYFDGNGLEGTIIDVQTVVIYDYAKVGNAIVLQGTYTVNNPGNANTVSVNGGQYSVTFNNDNTVTITGMGPNDQYAIETDTDFNTVLVNSDDSNQGTFDLGIFTLGRESAGIPINQDFDIVATDGDGDSVTGSIETTIVQDYPGNHVGTNNADILSGDAGNNSIAGNDGNDVINGNDGNDYLYGGAGNDVIAGGAGNDIIRGGNGDDQLNGGPGADTFIMSNSSVTDGSADTVTDYDPVEGDVIDLSMLLNVTGGTDLVADGYVRFLDDGTLQVDVDGGGDNWTTVATVYETGSTAPVVVYVTVDSLGDTPVPVVAQPAPLELSMSLMAGTTLVLADNDNSGETSKSLMMGSAIAMGFGLAAMNEPVVIRGVDSNEMAGDDELAPIVMDNYVPLEVISPIIGAPEVSDEGGNDGVEPLDGPMPVDSGWDIGGLDNGDADLAAVSPMVADQAPLPMPDMGASFGGGDVAMAGAEALAALGEAGGKGAPDLAAILGEAMVELGGEDAVSTALAALGEGDAALDQLAMLPANDAVSLWDSMQFGGFTAENGAFSEAEAAMLQPDAGLANG